MDAQQARKSLYTEMAKDGEFTEKAEEALNLGEQYLDVDNAHLTETNTESNYWKAIASTDPPDGDFPPGQRLDLQTTYCRRVLAEDDSIALHDAPNQDWDDDPAFETHGLHCYHGTPLTVDGNHYGTVCFVSKTPRKEPFSDDETLFAELIARMLEHELQRERTATRIERLEQFASILAHDLRNPLAGAIGFVEVTRETGDVEHLARAETALDRIEQMVSRGCHRKLDTVSVTNSKSLLDITNQT
jgi:GAF domain-containing protein